MNRKGRVELPHTMAIILIGVGGVLMMIFIAIIGLGTSVNILDKNIDQLNAVDTMLIVEKCFRNGNEYIQEDFLDENSGKDVCELCGICEVDIKSVWVEDLTDDRDWRFKSKRSATTSMIVSIESEEVLNIGRLHVKI